MSSRVETITCSHPWALAIAAFSSEPTVPITVAPRAFSHWQAISPTPPAAAWNRTVSPAFTGYVRRIRNWAVIPLSITAAAVSSDTPSGIGTGRWPTAPALGIRPGPAIGVCHAVAGFDYRDAGAHRLDDSRRLAPQPGRQGERVRPERC